MTRAEILTGIAFLCVATSAVIGFIAAFQTTPYSWALYVIGALISAGLGLVWAAKYLVRSP
jgi:uncharacterized membrane protein YccC